MARAVARFVVLGVIVAACGSTEEPGGELPPPEAVVRTAVQHRSLRQLEDELQAALKDHKRIDYEAIYAAAGALHAGAELILDDRPERVGPEDRTQYEGLVIRLKESALALQQASEQRSSVRCHRSFKHAVASCVRCHALFRSAAPPPGPPR